MGNKILEFAEAQGFKEGIAQGEAQGLTQGREADARKMHAKGYDPQEIFEITGIAPERLRQICVS